MKYLILSGFAVLAVLSSSTSLARDTVVNVPLSEVLDMPEAKEKLSGNVKFFLSGQQVPAKATLLESDVSNKKTSGVGKTDEQACRWAILSALLSFQDGAQKRGANAVVDMVSYYKKSESKSDTTIECHAGNIVAGVALKGRYAKLP